MKIHCIAIDDEPLALDIITDYCSKVPFLQLLKCFDNAIESIEYLKTNPVDLLFLDIQMDDLTGIQLLNVIKQKPQVIFTTAYDSYAIKGYELDVIDYLIKPISFERFIKAVDKAYEKLKAASVHHNNKISVSADDLENHKKYFFVKTEFRMQKVNFDDILYVEGQGDYLRIITKHEKIMTLQNFKHLEDVLPRNNFVRVHKSFMVAIDKIESIERNRIKIGERLIPIGETYKKIFFDFIENNQ
jgi:two-component system, LytTR family, response regulator